MSTYSHGTTRIVLPPDTTITACLPGDSPVDISAYAAPLLDAALHQHGGRPASMDVDLLDETDVHLECPVGALIFHEGAPVDGQLALVLIGRVVTTGLLETARSNPSGA